MFSQKCVVCVVLRFWLCPRQGEIDSSYFLTKLETILPYSYSGRDVSPVIWVSYIHVCSPPASLTEGFKLCKSRGDRLRDEKNRSGSLPAPSEVKFGVVHETLCCFKHWGRLQTTTNRMTGLIMPLGMSVVALCSLVHENGRKGCRQEKREQTRKAWKMSRRVHYTGQNRRHTEPRDMISTTTKTTTTHTIIPASRHRSHPARVKVFSSRAQRLHLELP